ncbi:MFS transporter, putative (macronuclear) [Tetrahymena thermophila SB210]|uniref:MFS transporter, putative n=1 Tax=Tetrahymena thermophila (strain SB210) TaxID=312017 RepID=Q23PS4_TETTS|nr:MFS transporter, putative [Tetrahymena thermophila SB210]EAR98611.2 MFS transporter, putative [Tetrahymena thermophila SB210]|eukprot:XP_001018856.2 MFS transporter, putative [Tetrahymena thermophila SB210]
MKKKLKIQFLIFLLIFLLIEINYAKIIQNCGLAILVDTATPNTIPACQECQRGYVVNYDFQSCILASELPMPLYSYCKRLDRNGECDEALSTLQIDQNQLIIKEDPSLFDPRCAKVDTVNLICISPRFPYTLDISRNYISHQLDSYCKIYNDVCVQNYETFYITILNKNYFKLYNFINPNQIDPSAIYDQQIKCLKPFVYQSIGCLPSNFNCNQHDSKTCLCEATQAVDSTGSTCSDQFQNCQMYGSIGQLQYCMACKSGFYLNQNICVPITLSNAPTCDSGYQLDQNGLNFLQTFLININPSISQDMSDPTFLIMLKYSIDFFKDPKYQQFKGSTPNFTFKCEQAPSTLVSGCIQSISNICIKCQSSEIYYIQQLTSSPILNLKYQAFCDLDIKLSNCKNVFKEQQITVYLMMVMEIVYFV